MRRLDLLGRAHREYNTKRIAETSSAPNSTRSNGDEHWATVSIIVHQCDDWNGVNLTKL